MLRALFNDIKEIVEAIPSINKVSHGKHVPITSEDNFNAVYIQPNTDVFSTFKNGTGINTYNNTIYVQLSVNIDNGDDALGWIDVRKDIITAILDDTRIWENIVNREVVAVTYDDGANDPKRFIEIVFEFMVRDTSACV